ncbi:MAG TPA: DNA primase DnaG [Candidatus Thermoplasmatota archaeon]|nr:DNA primase DnaG [Candidatus Thermoplasmatota archaeon]
MSNNLNIDPTTTKYLVRATIMADGVIEKPDVVGAIFGQTEGLLGDELDLRDLQKSGRIGRIEVTIDSKKGKSVGDILLPSSLDKLETAILAAALETIDRVGPAKAEIRVKGIEDVRSVKRTAVINRARELLAQIAEGGEGTSENILESVRDTFRVEDMVSYGPERLPAGPNVSKSDSIIVVEGRNDVANLLKHGIKNAIAVEGTNVPETIKQLCKDKSAIAFVDGDRGGELILKELLQTCEIDFLARAPRANEVEELTQKQLIKALRNKIPASDFTELYSLEGGNRPQRDNPRGGNRGRGGRGQPEDEEEDDDVDVTTPIEGVDMAPIHRTPAQRQREERREERRGGGRDQMRDERRGGGRSDERQERGGREDRAPREERREPREARDERAPRDERREMPRGRGEGEDAPRGRSEERAPRDAPRGRGEAEDAPPRGRSEERRPPREERAREAPVAADAEPAHDDEPAHEAAPARPAGERESKFLTLLEELSGKLQAVLLNEQLERVGDKVAVRDLADTLKKDLPGVQAVVFDGVVTQRLIDIALDKKIQTLVGVKTGNITKKPASVEVVTRADLA